MASVLISSFFVFAITVPHAASHGFLRAKDANASELSNTSKPSTVAKSVNTPSNASNSSSSAGEQASFVKHGSESDDSKTQARLKALQQRFKVDSAEVAREHLDESTDAAKIADAELASEGTQAASVEERIDRTEAEVEEETYHAMSNATKGSKSTMVTKASKTKQKSYYQGSGDWLALVQTLRRHAALHATQDDIDGVEDSEIDESEGLDDSEGIDETLEEEPDESEGESLLATNSEESADHEDEESEFEGDGDLDDTEDADDEESDDTSEDLADESVLEASDDGYSDDTEDADDERSDEASDDGDSEDAEDADDESSDEASEDWDDESLLQTSDDGDSDDTEDADDSEGSDETSEVSDDESLLEMSSGESEKSKTADVEAFNQTAADTGGASLLEIGDMTSEDVIDNADDEDNQATESADETSKHEIEDEVNGMEDEGEQDAHAAMQEVGGMDEEAAAEDEEQLQDESESLDASESF